MVADSRRGDMKELVFFLKKRDMKEYKQKPCNEVREGLQEFAPAW